MSEIKFADPNSVVGWLKGKPGVWAGLLAIRLSLRVLPVVLGASGLRAPNSENKSFILQSFRVAFLSWYAASLDDDPVNRNLLSAEDALDAESVLVSGVTIRFHDDPHAAGVSLQRAVDVWLGLSSSNILECIEFAIKSVRDPSGRSMLLRSLEADAGWLASNERSRGLMRQPLWLQDVRAKSKYIANFPEWARQHFDHFAQSDLVKSGPWGVWAAWYRGVLPDSRSQKPGSVFGEIRERKVAWMPKQFWERGPDRVVEDLQRVFSGQELEEIDSQPGGTISDAILRYLEDMGRPVTIQEIVGDLTVNGVSSSSDSIRGRVNELYDSGRIRRVSRGVYSVLEGESDPKDSIAKEIPDQEPGIMFAPDPSGRLRIAESGKITDSDSAEVEAIKETLLESLDDLEAACEGSNAFSFLIKVSGRYRAALEKNTDEISIDQLYAQGIRLENAKVRVDQEIQTGDLPEQGVNVGEALDSVIALHGPMIMGTERGRLLVSRSREFHQTEAQVAEYKAIAIRFATAVEKTEDLIAPESKEFVVTASAEIGEGRHPSRSTDLAHTANTNLIVVMGKIATSPAGVAATAVFSQAVAASTPGTLATAELTSLINAVWTFCLSNSELLRAMAGATGGELSWVNSLLNWMSKKRRPEI